MNFGSPNLLPGHSGRGREQVWNKYGDLIITRPVDKGEFYQTLRGALETSSGGQRPFNGQWQTTKEEFPESQRYYKLTVPPNGYLDNEALEQMGIQVREEQGDKIQIAANMYLVNVTNKEKRNLKLPAGYQLTDFVTDPEGQLFPYYSNRPTGHPIISGL